MSEEFMRVDVVIGTTGETETKNKLRATDKFIDSTRKRAELLNKMRISPAARLIDRISGPTKRIMSSLTALSRRSWTVTIAAKDMAFGAITRIKNALFSLPALLGIGAGAYGGVFAPLNLSGQMEQSAIAFETMLGSAAKAKAFLSDLQNFANNTPFEFPKLQDSSKRLLAFGFGAERILPMMTALGNAASGLSLGGDGVSRLSVALGQMKAKGKVSAEEMLQLTEAGIPAWDMLAKRMGITTSQVMKLSERGLIPADKAIDALIDGMNQRFPNLMAKQSKSLLGLSSNIKDTFNNKILLKWGDGIRAGIQPRLQQLVDWIGNNEATIDRWGETLKRTASSAADWIGDKFEEAFSYLNTQYFSNPEFQKLDFGGKVEYVVADLSDKLWSWYNDKGKDKLVSFGESVGSSILNGMGNVFQDGLSHLWETNKKAFTQPSWDNTMAAATETGIYGFLGYQLAKKLKIPSLLKKVFKGSPAAVVAEGSAATTAASTAAASRTLVQANPKSPYAPGWNPRYQTLPKEVNPPKAPPGGGVLGTASKFATRLGLAGIAYQAITTPVKDWFPSKEEAKKDWRYQMWVGDMDRILPERHTDTKKSPQEMLKLTLDTIGVLKQSNFYGTPEVKVPFKTPDQTMNNDFKFNFQPGLINLQVSNEINYDELAKQVGYQMAQEIKRVLENRH